MFLYPAAIVQNTANAASRVSMSFRRERFDIKPDLSALSHHFTMIRSQLTTFPVLFGAYVRVLPLLLFMLCVKLGFFVLGADRMASYLAKIVDKRKVSGELALKDARGYIATMDFVRDAFNHGQLRRRQTALLDAPAPNPPLRSLDSGKLTPLLEAINGRERNSARPLVVNFGSAS